MFAHQQRFGLMDYFSTFVCNLNFNNLIGRSNKKWIPEQQQGQDDDGKQRAGTFQGKWCGISWIKIKTDRKNVYQTMKINRINLKKASIIATATLVIISTILRITHTQGADTFLFIALLCFIFTASLKIFKKWPTLKHRSWHLHKTMGNPPTQKLLPKDRIIN